MGRPTFLFRRLRKTFGLLPEPACSMSFRCYQFHRVPVEGNKGFGAEPLPFIGDDAIREVAARVEQCQTRFHGWPVHHDIDGIDQVSDRLRDVR